MPILKKIKTRKKHSIHSPCRRLIKILLIGEATGKDVLFNSLMARLSGYINLIGSDFAVERFTSDQFETIFQVWSLSDLNKYNSIRPLFCQGAFGAFVFFDFNKPESFEKVLKYIPEIIDNNPSRVVAIALMGYLSKNGQNGKGIISQEQINELMDDLSEKLNHKVLYFRFAKFQREDVIEVCNSIMADISKLNKF